MARPLSTRALALRALRDPGNGAATRWQALLTIRPHVSPTEFDKLLRQFIAATPRGKQLRLAMALLTEIENGERAQAAAEAKKRAEIDAVLRECEAELAKGPKSIPESAAPMSGEPYPAPSSDPADGVLDEALGRIADDQERPARKQESIDELLAEGHQLQDIILAQTQRCWRAVHNKEEAAKLASLQSKWRDYERAAVAAGIDVKKQFGDKLQLLRPFVIKVDLSRIRKSLSVPELSMMLPDLPTHEKPEPDCGFWSGLPPGI